jgi:hypothetical protein
MNAGPAMPHSIPNVLDPKKFKCYLKSHLAYQAFKVEWGPINAAAGLHNGDETWFCGVLKGHLEQAAQAISHYKCYVVEKEDKIVVTGNRPVTLAKSLSDAIRNTFPGSPNVDC